MPRTDVPRHNFMGCPIDTYTFDEAVGEILKRIEQHSATALVHFLNAAKIVKAAKNDYLRQALWDGDLVLADGKPLLFFGRAIGIGIPTRVNGTDLMLKLINECETQKYSIYLLGAKQDVIEECVENIKKIHPNIRIAGYRNGFFKNVDIDTILETINVANPDILFIGMSTPQKEFLAFENRNKLHVPIVQGVGGSFDVIAGLVQRAPKWMQDWGLEWLYRVIQEPRRMFWRYLSANTIFFLMYIKHFLYHLFESRKA